MANLTLTIDDDVLRRPRIRALERDTSVNAVVREFLASYAGASEVEQALDEHRAAGGDKDAPPPPPRPA
ncbi:MAG: hypothetical protein M3276_04530 [Actinomycetota bacterium]|nr:hypothetical protein [Actinomycetota bacterium]